MQSGEEFCLNFANFGEAVQQKTKSYELETGTALQDVCLDCEVFFSNFFRPRFVLLHNKVVFTEFDPNLCTNDDTSLQLYNLTAPERQALNFYREFFKRKSLAVTD